MTLKGRRTDVYVTSSRRIDIILISCACWVGPRQMCKKLSDLENDSVTICRVASIELKLSSIELSWSSIELKWSSIALSW